MFLSTDNRIKENNCFQFLDNIKHADGNKQLFFIPIYDSLEPKASWSHSSSICNAINHCSALSCCLAECLTCCIHNFYNS